MDDRLRDIFTYNANEEEHTPLREAIKVLPLKKMGLEQEYTNMQFQCSYGTFNSVIIRPEDDVLHSIWIPRGATNVHSTEEYQAFRYKGIDYFIYRRPKNHVKKVIAY
ncbi:MAG: hypothetical protein ACLFTR_02475 [Candidatus Woesearchaeota archaeon]